MVNDGQESRVACIKCIKQVLARVHADRRQGKDSTLSTFLCVVKSLSQPSFVGSSYQVLA